MTSLDLFLQKKILIEYLKKSRWFGGKTQKILKIDILENIPFCNGNFTNNLLVIKVFYKGGSSELYSLPVSYALGNESLRIKQNSPESIISYIKKKGLIIYDGTYNKKFQQKIFDIVLREEKLKGTKGKLSGICGKNLKKIICGKKISLNSYVLKTEQTNNSIVYGDKFILKFFRKLNEGVNPEFEMLKFITEETEFKNVPFFLGSVEYEVKNHKPVCMGILQTFIKNRTDAWRYSIQNVKKYFERVISENVKTADEKTIEGLIGRTYIENIKLLGKRTGQMHLALGSKRNRPEFRPEKFSFSYRKEVFVSLRSLTDRVFSLLEKSCYKFSHKLKEDIKEILSSKEEIIKCFREVLKKSFSVSKMRIHGDYHLGQVLFTGKDFFIIDFEGEPGRLFEDRRKKLSPIKDVAGMLRSFQYCVYFVLYKELGLKLEEIEKLHSFADGWYEYISDVFLNSYLKICADENIVPKYKEDFFALLKIFLLEKVIYEIGYELNNRPDWIVIPVEGMKYILKSLNIKIDNPLSIC